MSRRCGLRKMRSISRPVPRPAVVKICQGWGMSWWKLATLIICVGFRSRDVSDLVFFVFGGWMGNNLPGSGHDLVATGYLDHLCQVSKAWHFGLGNVVFGGWLGDCLNVIFGNAIKTWCCNNMPGSSHELVEIGHRDQLCWVLKTWWVILGRLGFGCWPGDFQNSVIFNVIVRGINLILMEYMVIIFNYLVTYTG